MAAVLGSLALLAVVFGVVNLVRPTGLLGVSDRGRAGWWVAVSSVIFMVAVVSGDPDPKDGPTPTTLAENGRQSTTSSLRSESSTTSEVGTTSTPPASSTSSAGATTTSSRGPAPQPDVFGPPVAGPSGDPDGPLIPSAEVATVLGITDGDTIDVVRGDGSTDTVRLIGVNAPERGECWAPEAARVLEALASSGEGIGMSIDESDRDQFGRLLRYLWLGSLSINEELVRRGAAISRRYPPDTALAERLEAAQDDAMSAGLGLWAPDACGPSVDAELRFGEWRPDAAGNDNENLNDEWIRIQNEGDGVVDLTGWGIRDESASNRFAFPSEFTLIPGEVVTVYSGCGEDFGTDLYWCSVGSAIWNNDGDTAFLTDPSGNTHTSRSYAP